MLLSGGSPVSTVKWGAAARRSHPAPRRKAEPFTWAGGELRRETGYRHGEVGNS